MRKKKKKSLLSTSEKEVDDRVRIGIFNKNFTKVIACGPHIHHRVIKKWSVGQIVTDEKELKELEEIGAPIEVYYRDAD